MRKKVGKACISFALFILVIALVTCIDLAPIGPANTTVGLSHLNGAVHNLIGVHMIWYKITNYLGYLAILSGLVFAGIGCKQLVERKSLGQVDMYLLPPLPPPMPHSAAIRGRSAFCLQVERVV